MAIASMNVGETKNGLNKAKNEILQQDTALDHISTEINSMGNIWEDAAQEVHATNFVSTKQRVHGFLESLSKYVENIEGFVDNCVNLDNGYGTMIGNVTWTHVRP